MTLTERITRPFTVTLLMLLMTVATVWADGAKTLPYYYGFENNDLAAEGWMTVDCLEGSRIFRYQFHSGNYCFYFKPCFF